MKSEALNITNCDVDRGGGNEGVFTKIRYFVIDMIKITQKNSLTFGRNGLLLLFGGCRVSTKRLFVMRELKIHSKVIYTSKTCKVKFPLFVCKVNYDRIVFDL